MRGSGSERTERRALSPCSGFPGEPPGSAGLRPLPQPTRLPAAMSRVPRPAGGAAGRPRCRSPVRRPVPLSGQGKDKDRMKEGKEKDARYTNGHLFTTISVSGMTMCFACNKSITAKEALVCPSECPGGGEREPGGSREGAGRDIPGGCAGPRLPGGIWQEGEVPGARLARWHCWGGFTRVDLVEWLCQGGFGGMALPEWIWWNGCARVDLVEWLCQVGVSRAELPRWLCCSGFARLALLGWLFQSGAAGVALLQCFFWDGSSGVSFPSWFFQGGKAGVDLMGWLFQLGSARVALLQWLCQDGFARVAFPS